MSHLLVDCTHVSKLWQNLERWIQHFLDIKIQLNAELILLNNFKGTCVRLINTFIIILKQYIYASKCMSTLPNFATYIEKIVIWHNIERQAAWEANLTNSYVMKWKKYVDL